MRLRPKSNVIYVYKKMIPITNLMYESSPPHLLVDDCVSTPITKLIYFYTYLILLAL